MKYLSDNLLVFVLAFVLGFSPIQSISASVSNCLNMGSNMHAQMMMSDKHTQTMNMENSDNTADCCSQDECSTTHCTSVTAAVINSSNIYNNTYILGVFYQKPNSSLIPFYSSSLYRPPKI